MVIGSVRTSTSANAGGLHGFGWYEAAAPPEKGRVVKDKMKTKETGSAFVLGTL